jgi:hypothetical protein
MRRGIRAGVALAFAGACFSTPARPATGDALESLDDGGSDAGDAVTIIGRDGDPNLCTTDLFLGAGSGCGTSSWGMPQQSNGGAMLTGTGTGELQLTIYGGDVAYASCTSAAAAWRRVTLDVQAVGTSLNREQTFAGIVNGADRWGVEFDYDDISGKTTLAETCSNALVQTVAPLPGASRESWNAVQQRYLQVDRTGDTTLVFRASPDNVNFTEVGTCTLADGTPLDTSTVQLRIERSASTVASASSKFGHIELCHD